VPSGLASPFAGRPGSGLAEPAPLSLIAARAGQTPDLIWALEV
jgi:hypothetical protein